MSLNPTRTGVSPILWIDTENVCLDSGSEVHVHDGIIGLNMDGTQIYTGGAALMVARDNAGNPSKALTVAEKLDVARRQVRMWQMLADQLEIAMTPKKPGGMSGYKVDVE